MQEATLSALTTLLGETLPSGGTVRGARDGLTAHAVRWQCGCIASGTTDDKMRLEPCAAHPQTSPASTCNHPTIKGEACRAVVTWRCTGCEHVACSSHIVRSIDGRRCTICAQPLARAVAGNTLSAALVRLASVSTQA